MSDRQGIEIDYCPTCRGVWLDRGELDKLIERGSGAMPSQASQPREQPYQSGSYHPARKHKKEGLLGDIFDF